MVNLWHKYKSLPYGKKRTLRSLGVGCVFFLILYIITRLFSVSVCPIKNLFGISCFGCGLTRGFIEILHFRFKSATICNVMSVPLFFGILLYFILAVADIFYDKNYIEKIEKQLAKKYMYFIYLLILTVSSILNNIY